MSKNYTPFQHRLAKMARHFDKWARRKQLAAYRIYDADLDEFPITVDRYGEQLYVAIYAPKGRPLSDEDWRDLRHDYREVIMETLDVDRNAIFFKLRQRAKGGEQYDKLAWVEREFLVQENGLTFSLNLTDYLDTGLFLDHRQTRQMVRERAAGKRVLNLFAYTCSFTVYAAAGGAATTHSIDLSNTYLEWGKRNLELNGFPADEMTVLELQSSQPSASSKQPAPHRPRKKHRFQRTDVKQWLSQEVSQPNYDLIILDPPTFSNSKAMKDVLDTQRDHVELINNCLKRLRPGGELFFSTNYRRFKLAENEIIGASSCQEISKQTQPPDFRKRPPHRCWLFTIHP
ncbi:MAG: class I SAM-dependent methyltransferase [Bacteroidota bacterium]